MNRPLLAIMVLSLFAVAIAWPGLAQDETGEVELRVLRDRDSLTILFSGSTAVPFHSIQIDIFRPDGSIDSVSLSAYSNFGSLQRRPLAVPACLRLEWEDSTRRFPVDCAALSADRRRVEPLSAVDIFWLDREADIYYGLELYQGETFIGECPPSQAEGEPCVLSFVPGPMPPGPARPTATPTRTPAPAAPAAPTPTPGSAAGVLCSGPVTTTSSAQIITQVYSDHSTRGLRQAPIRVGTVVNVVERYADGGAVWFRITDASGAPLGWVQSANVRSCQ